MKYKVLLFQAYLRKPTLNFGKYLKNFKFVRIGGNVSKFSYKLLPAYREEILRRKDTSLLVRFRRLVGLPNIRIRLDRHADVLFTYGCLVFGTKPFVIYLENGLALYNYDLRIARHPLARALTIWLTSRRQCAKLVFMSEAARKSFFSTVKYPSKVEKSLRRKSIVIYPIIAQTSTSRTFHHGRRFLFAGHFYMKGGLELAYAFARLQKNHPETSLTIITTLRMIRDTDLAYIESIPGLRLVDATLEEEEMTRQFQAHDVFVLPTYREGFGLVLLEALASGMPIIANEQFATGEMVVHGANGFLFRQHPMQDYDSFTYQMFGRYHNPKDFYKILFRLQKQGRMKQVEDFLFRSMSQLAESPEKCQKFAAGSRQLYEKRFSASRLGQKMESIFEMARREFSDNHQASGHHS